MNSTESFSNFSKQTALTTFPIDNEVNSTDGSLGDKLVKKVEEGSCLTMSKIRKIAFIAFGTLAVLGAAAAFTLAATVGTGDGIFLLNYLGGWLLGLGVLSFVGGALEASQRDYNDPKQLNAMREAAKTMKMDALIQEHSGIERIKQYNIVPEERIDAYEAALNLESTSYEEALRSRFPLYQWQQELRTLEALVKPRKDFEVRVAREKIAREAGLSPSLDLSKWPAEARAKFTQAEEAIVAKETESLGKLNRLKTSLELNTASVDKAFRPDLEEMEKEHQERLAKLRKEEAVPPRPPADLNPLEPGLADFEEIEARVEVMSGALESICSSV